MLSFRPVVGVAGTNEDYTQNEGGLPHRASDQYAQQIVGGHIGIYAGAIRNEVETSLDTQKNYVAAADAVRRLMFIEKLEHEIEDALEALES